MKKLMYVAFSFIMLLSTVSTASAKDKALTETQQVKLEQLTTRVEQIRDMDKSSLNRQEKKALRSELKQMKSEANAIGNGGVYLSVTAIVIIALVLILIL